MRWVLTVAGVVLVVAVAISTATFFKTGLTDASNLYPGQFDSVVIPSRGFPLAQWATNDPAITGIEEERSTILWGGWLFNTVLFFVPILPLALIYAFAIRRLLFVPSPT